MKHRKFFSGAIICLCVVMLLSACSSLFGKEENNRPQVPDPDAIVEENDGEKPDDNVPEDDGENNQPSQVTPDSPTVPVEKDPNAVHVVANSDDIIVLVNKQFRLPQGYKPTDLVEPDVPFIFEEKNEKRFMRQEAASALEALFAAATKDGIHLAGVSGFRSESTQTSLYKRYVERDGEEAANQYSAKPGHSEHQTGLTIDVSGSTAKCAVQDCFADTEEAKWIAKHAHEHGFIVRYPLGKEEITGYQYEPWHIRYVGIEDATQMFEQDVTLEEYLQDAIPVMQTN